MSRIGYLTAFFVVFATPFIWAAPAQRVVSVRVPVRTVVPVRVPVKKTVTVPPRVIRRQTQKVSQSVAAPARPRRATTTASQVGASPYVVGPTVNLITPDLAAWTRDGKDQPPGKGWEVVDGKLHRKSGAGDLISKHEYDNFILDFSWTIAQGGNSGIKYRLTDYPKVEGVSLAGWLGLEYQVLDDFNTGEGKNPRVATASVYHVHKASEAKPLKPHDEVNVGRIIVCGNLVEHWLNGVCVSRIVVGSTEWKKNVAAGKFAEVVGFGQNRSGHILVQDHGSEVTFHTLKVRELTKNTAKR
ncbi:MAG: 3-keto-disaccharide hydrolase [Thermoguttaceae bacterium]